MKINFPLLKLKLTTIYKNINIAIYDNKNWVNLFGANYDKFLFRNKGISIKNKEQLLQILNNKPRTLLSTLRILVKGLKVYNSQLQWKLTSLRSNKNLTSSKLMSRKDFLLRLRDQHLSSSLKGMSPNVAKSQLEQNNLITANIKTNNLTANLNKITDKINQLTKSLSQNKLATPLNLLTPLFSQQISKSTSLKTNQAKYNLNPKKNEFKLENEFNLPQIISETNNSRLQLLEANNYQTSNTPKVTELTKLIANYNENNLNSISKTQYSKLINPFKSVNPFEQNLTYNFNANNNRKSTQHNITTLLEYAFRGMSSLISKPVFMETPQSLVINLFYFFVPGQVDKQKNLKRVKSLQSKRISMPIATSLNGISIPSNPNKKFKKGAKSSNSV